MQKGTETNIVRIALTAMDKIIIKWPQLTTAQVILAIVLFISIWLAFLTVDISYNRAVNTANTKTLVDQTNSIHKILEAQGNLSGQQRQQLLHQFAVISQHGGFATQEDTQQNKAILSDLNQSSADNKAIISSLNQSFTGINAKLDKLDKLLNHTR